MVLRHFDGDLTRANLSPRKREKLLAAYPSPTTSGGAGDVPEAGAGGGLALDEVLAARCPGCGYTYDVVAGEEREGFAAGTAWSQIPNDWCCPDGGVRDKVDFVSVEPRPA